MRQYMHQQLLHAPLGPKRSSSAGQRSGVSERTFNFEFIFDQGAVAFVGSGGSPVARWCAEDFLTVYCVACQSMMGRSVEKKYSHRLGSVNLSSSGFMTSRYDFELPKALNPSISSNQSST